MGSKKIIQAVISMTILSIVMSMLAFGVGYSSDRMNHPSGSMRQHTQFLTGVTGNVTTTIPSGFNLTGYSAGAVVNAFNITWISLVNSNVNYTLESPLSCSEGALSRSDIYVNGSSIGFFPFICIPDTKVTDFKVEYGHGNANYLGSGDELFISNRSVTLFNLARVFNLGHLLEPNENPSNVTLFCQYELLPVRTYGPGEVRRDNNNVNMTFSWESLNSGYWFRIGVLSQDFSARPIGTKYNVTCQNLTYQFGHTAVIAAFTNYTLEARSESPFYIAHFNDTSNSQKQLVLIQNIEKYTTYDLKIVFAQPNHTAVSEYPLLSPNQSLIFRIDNASSTNVSVYFIPSWYLHSTDPVIISQSLFLNVSQGQVPSAGNFSPNITSHNPACPASVVAGGSLDFNITKTDLDDDTLNVTFILNGNIVQQAADPFPYQSDNFTMSTNVSDAGTAHNLTINVSDGSNSTNFTCIVNVISNATSPGGGSGGSSGGGHGSRWSAIQKVEQCNPRWECTPWTPCLGGEKRRSCRDEAGCEKSGNKPSESEVCVFSPVIVSPQIINVTFKPTCFDGIRNQGEEGTDCGGPCNRCVALAAVQTELPVMANAATACGDGKCGQGEECGCIEDCGLDYSCPQAIRTIMWVLILLLLVVLAYFLIFRSDRRKTYG